MHKGLEEDKLVMEQEKEALQLRMCSKKRPSLMEEASDKNKGSIPF